jgi:glycosyltransferase involved in cell wall biosynthesis
VSAARNTGWRAARAPLVLFIGDDILGVPELLAEHLAWHEARGGPDVGVLGHVRWAPELRVTPFMRWLDQGIQFAYGTIDRDEATWGHFYTSNISVPRALLEEIGGFDEERFPFLYEDLDVGYRLYERGFRLLYNRRALGDHLHPTTIEDYRRRVAATAPAERRWVEHRPEMPAYFHDLFADAAGRPRAYGPGRALLAHVSPEGSRLGRLAWESADIYYRQQLAPAYLAAWHASAPAQRA